ncbi:MAG: diacylglycerol kinase family protein [Candidatus Margulisiibacteriota bacterium]
MKPNRTLFHSLWDAASGLVYVFKSQRNMRIHGAMGLVAIGLGIKLGLSPSKWGILCISIALVLIAEAFNTALECTVDMVTKKWRPRAKISKDVAAGAVLMAVFNALVVGYLLFFHKLASVMSIYLGGHFGQ